jgi:fructokinase
MYGGIEAGGTKWVCAVGTGAGEVVAEERFPTTTPAETIGRAVAFFQQHKNELQAVGVGSFGPVDLHAGSPTYGYITTTPKQQWQFADVVGPLEQALGVPVGFDTDVNAAALGEHRWGAARGLENFVYLTIGTGIGGGGMVNGRLLHGALHPEMGHMLLPQHLARESSFGGVCPFHGHCLEGLASGPAIEARWGVRAETLPEDHPAWELEAHYLALGLVNIICVLSPERIIMGGGVMHQRQVFTHLHAEVRRRLNDYLRLPQITERIEEYIVAPGLQDQAGVKGAMALAEMAAEAAR